MPPTQIQSNSVINSHNINNNHQVDFPVDSIISEPKLYVSDLQFSITENELRDLFEDIQPTSKLDAYNTYLSLHINDPTSGIYDLQTQTNALILHVRQLSTTNTNISLFNIFRPYGPLFSVRMQVQDNKFKGSAFVQYFRKEDADKAVANLNSKDNKAMIVQYHRHNNNKAPNRPIVDPCNLFIKNLDSNISSSDLFSQFRRFGKIISARVMRDQETGNSKGFGFVSYSSSEEADKAKQSMHGKTLGAKPIVVRLHEPKKLREAKLANQFSPNTGGSDLEEKEVLEPNLALRLQSKLIKRIAEFLDSRDRYNLCLVNKTWSPTAMNVLWSEPIFKTPDSLDSFLRAVKQSKQRALRVRVLNLCAPDESVTNSFAPVLSSEHPVHKTMSRYVLSKPTFITSLVELCEKLHRIKVYGWNLTDHHVQSLSQYCPELKEILVVGNSQLTYKAFNSLMSCIPNLLVLDLDGDFNLSDNFAEALAIKCPSLVSLKLSTKAISEKGFDILATKLTKLNNLVLQNCSNLTDKNIEHFAEKNPKLQNLQLLGETLTIKSFKVVMYLKELINFDLRCLQEVDNLSNEIEWLRPVCHNLRIITLENLPINDDAISAITVHCKHLEKIGLSKCPHITNNSINSIAKNENNLYVLDLIECKNVTDMSLKYLGRKTNSSLTHIIIDSCGQFIPETVHWFVKSSPKLEKIVFNGTPSITNSFVYQFATEQQNASYDSDSVGDAHQKCTIEKENIKKLAQFQQKMPLSFPNKDKLDALSSELVTPNSNINFYHCMSPPQSMTANEFQSEYFQNIPDTKSSFSTTSVSSSSNHSQLQDNHFSEKTPINGRKDFNSMEHQQEKGRNGSSAVQYSTSTIEIDIDNNIEKMPPIKLPQIKPLIVTL
ncbi:1468_t:CDS:10 [Entrophospora sp. SA101]|nr:1468_t:CDS:10 [Entrophospora sp. SA101]